MKISDQQLRRLLEAAANERAPEEPLPSSLETRILARWRSRTAPDEFPEMLRWLRIGFGLACLLLLITAVFGVRELNRERNEELAMPNVVINLAFTK